MEKWDVVDKGGRRLGIDRRQVLISKRTNRRNRLERRLRKDRRKKWRFNEDSPAERRRSFYIK